MKIIKIMAFVLIMTMLAGCTIGFSSENSVVTGSVSTADSTEEIETSEDIDMTDASNANTTENTTVTTKPTQPATKIPTTTIPKTRPNPTETQPSYPNGLDPAIEQKIKEDYIKYKKSIYPDSDLTMESKIIYVFIGSFSFGNVFFPSGQAMQAIMPMTIAGYGFCFPDSRPLLVHTNSTFYWIKDAYENGIITEDEVGQIHKTYYNL